VLFCVILVPKMDLPGGTSLSARRRFLTNPVFGFWHELPGGDEHPPGDTNMFHSFVMFWGF